jgi:hypothetical protein
MKEPDIVIALDLSFHCSGFAILNKIDKTVSVGILPSHRYGYNIDNKIPKMLKANVNSVSILKAMHKMFYKYRHFNVRIVYESMPYKFKRRQTNSDMDLHGMQCHVANSLATLFETYAAPVMPGIHKQALTGTSKADKALSIHHFLLLYPQAANWFQKLDDVADAFGLLCVGHKHCFPEYELIKLTY